MASYQTTVNRILDELDRTGDLTSQAQLAIQSAITHYEGWRFWFNEDRYTADTVNGQEWYELPTNFKDDDSLVVTVNNYSYPVTKRHYNQLEEWYVNTSSFTGYPTDYAIYGEQLRLYPVPNGSYEMIMSFQKQLSSLAADADSNEWTTSAEELIRSRAEKDLCARILQDAERAVLFSQMEQDALGRLIAETNRRLMTGRSKKRTG